MAHNHTDENFEKECPYWLDVAREAIAAYREVMQQALEALLIYRKEIEAANEMNVVSPLKWANHVGDKAVIALREALNPTS